MEDVPISARAADPAWEIEASPKHGRGLFATRPLLAGERILEYIGKRISLSEVEDDPNGCVFAVAIDDEWALDGDCPDNPARFANHACTPNCELELIDNKLILCATQEIKIGDEITFDYGCGLEGLFKHKCRCETAGCVGYIIGAPYRPKARRILAQMRRR